MINSLSNRIDSVLSNAVLAVMLAGLPLAGVLFVTQSFAV